MLKALIYTVMHVNYFSIKLEKKSVNIFFFFFSQEDSIFLPITIVLGNILYLTSSQPEI